MTKPGFYRVAWCGQGGVGYCYHSGSIGEKPFEVWDILHTHRDPFGDDHVVTSHVSGRSPAFSRLVVGKRIRGLP
jgi:hypothetical protein